MYIISEAEKKNKGKEVHSECFGRPGEVGVEDTVTKKQFKLPNVRELVKRFGPNDQLYIQKTEIPSENNSNREVKTFLDEKYEESGDPVPVSEIILNLTNILALTSHHPHQKSPLRKNSSVENNGEKSLETKREKISKKVDKTFGVKSNGKEVHSLTARSISKEFREGLKNNSTPQMRVPNKRAEGTDQGNIVYHKGNTSPTFSVDLKNIKKFWEEIIITNSPSQK